MDDSLPQSIYSVKQCKRQRILTQAKNGPCPVLALCNTLMLSGRIPFPTESGVSAQDIMNQIGNLILQADHLDQDSISAVYDTFSSRQLLTGLDINVKFYNCQAFEFSAPLSVFDCLRVKLYHCWVASHEKIKGLSYNQLTVALCEEDCPQILKDWYSETMNQATSCGLVDLNETMKNGEISVLFKSNHFFTVTKQHDRLFTLVTDQGYLKSQTVMWEDLTLFGGGDFFNEDFMSTDQIVQSDAELARKLQQAEMQRELPQASQGRPMTTYDAQMREQARIRRDREKSKCGLM